MTLQNLRLKSQVNHWQAKDAQSPAVTSASGKDISERDLDEAKKASLDSRDRLALEQLDGQFDHLEEQDGC